MDVARHYYFGSNDLTRREKEEIQVHPIIRPVT